MNSEIINLPTDQDHGLGNYFLERIKDAICTHWEEVVESRDYKVDMRAKDLSCLCNDNGNEHLYIILIMVEDESDWVDPEDIVKVVEAWWTLCEYNDPLPNGTGKVYGGFNSGDEGYSVTYQTINNQAIIAISGCK